MIYRTRSEILSSVLYLSDMPYGGYIKRLNSCKAWIIRPNFSNFLILQSYSTIVAAYQYSTSILWVFGFYSHTTAKHVSKFRDLILHNYYTGWNYPVTVRLYNDSRTGKRAARKNLDDDFASVISAVLNQH